MESLIRFKVIRAKSIWRWLILLALSGLLLIMLWRLMIRDDAAATITMGTSIVNQTQTNEVVAVFAATASFDSPLFSPRMHMGNERAKITIERLPTHTAEPESAEQQRVLIYHTHTHEAYEQTAADPYEETAKWRTADKAHSVVRVGDELAKLLKAKGVAVVHDQTDYEPPKLGTAYTRSLKMLEAYNNQQFDLVIDLHRDAYAEGMGENSIAIEGSKRAALLMILLGNGEGFKEKPFFVENMAFAKQLTLAINAECANLGKDVMVKNGRYNQHVMSPSILVEVGNNMNTLDEALNALPALAKAIDAALQGEVFF